MREKDGVKFEYEYFENGVNVNHFYVKGDKRRLGNGSRVLNDLISKFEDEGYDYVVVNMGGGRAAVEFLQSNDFDIVEHRGDHVTAEIEI